LTRPLPLDPTAVVRLALAAVLAAACRAPTAGERPDRAACPQTYEFGNHGCARVLALVEGPPLPWPASYRFDVHATPARPVRWVEPALATTPGVGPVPLQLTRWEAPPSGVGTAADTLSVWVVARLLEDPRPIQVGVPLPTFAADSVLRVVRFADVGSVPPVDTVRLTLRRP
jgi:hypothetical protein